MMLMDTSSLTLVAHSVERGQMFQEAQALLSVPRVMSLLEQD